MMARLSILLFLIAFGTRAFSTSLHPDPKFQTLVQFAESDLEASHASGVAIGIVESGKVTFTAGLGVKQVGNFDSITPQSLFAVESFSKSVTAAAILSLVDEGQIDLNAPVTRYVPYFNLAPPWDAHSVTVRELLLHTSGFPTFDVLTPPFDNTQASALAKFFQIFNSESLPAQPGIIWNYSNYGYALLGLIVERVSGLEYAEAVRNRVLIPAKLNATFDHAEAQARDHTFSHFLNSANQKIAQDFTLDAENYFGRPFGGLWASVEDLANFGEMLLSDGGRVLSSRSTTEMMSPQVSKGTRGDYYGYGLHSAKGSFTANDAQDDLLVWAAGDGLGSRSILKLDPAKGFGIAVITNEGSYNLQKIVDKAFELYLGQSPRARSDATSDASGWDVYVGTYRDAKFFGEMIVSLESARLYIKFVDHNYKTELTQYSGDVFIFIPPPNLLPLPEGFPGIAATFWRDSPDGVYRYLATRVGVGLR